MLTNQQKQASRNGKKDENKKRIKARYIRYKKSRANQSENNYEKKKRKIN
jgi:hypothetical protein